MFSCQLKRTFSDLERTVNSGESEFEVDVFSMESSVVMECTSVLNSTDILKTLLRKRAVLSKLFGKEFKAYCVCFKIDEDVLSELLAFMRNNDITFVRYQSWMVNFYFNAYLK